MNSASVLKLITPLAKMLPSFRPESRPRHCGEIYYLWESLTGGYKIVSTLETYLMNSEDTDLHIALKNMIGRIEDHRIKPMKKALKGERFTLPPEPGTKMLQGKPGVGQEVKLSDDEIIVSLMQWTQFALDNDARAIGVTISKSIRKLFVDLLFSDLKSYVDIMDLGDNRHVYHSPPPATAQENCLNIAEVARLWEEISARELTIINLECYLANTNDKELIDLLHRIIDQIAIPQLKRMEDILKKEGFTVPPRPMRRIEQAEPEKGTKIMPTEREILGNLGLGAQSAILYHVRSFCVALRNDIRDMFKSFISTEIEEFENIMTLATNRHTLEVPPLTTSHKG